MAVALAYQLRLPARLRLEFAERIDGILREQQCPPELNVQSVVSACMNRLYDGTFVPKGIAPTRYAHARGLKSSILLAPESYLIRAASCTFSLYVVQCVKGKYIRLRRLPSSQHPSQYYWPPWLRQDLGRPDGGREHERRLLAEAALPSPAKSAADAVPVLRKLHCI